jgi:hypothetical protein
MTENSSLVARDNTVCGGQPDFNVCGQGLPSSWCCSNNYTCLPIHGTNSATAICCPEGSNCTTILPINSTVMDDPLGSVHVDGTPPILPRCSGGYCPPGYDCLNEICWLRANTRLNGHQQRPFALGVGAGIAVGTIVWLVCFAVWFFCWRKSSAQHSNDGISKPDTGRDEDPKCAAPKESATAGIQSRLKAIFRTNPNAEVSGSQPEEKSAAIPSPTVPHPANRPPTNRLV